MPVRPSSLEAYVLATLAAAIAVAAALLAAGGWGGSPWWLVALIFAGGFAANNFPLHLGDKTKVFVDTAIFTAAALILAPAVAGLVAAAAVLLRHLLTRRTWQQTLFNPAQTAIYVGLGGLAFHLVADLAHPPLAQELALGAAVVAGVVVMHLLNTAIVAGMVATHAGQPAFATWIEGLAIDLPEHIALTATGIVLAGVLGHAPWVAPLLVAPVAVVYASLRTTLELRAASQELAETADRLGELVGRPVRVERNPVEPAIHAALALPPLPAAFRAGSTLTQASGD